MKGVGNIVSVALAISVGFYTLAMTLYSNVSTAGETTNILVIIVERIQSNRSWKTYSHTFRHCCGKWGCRLRSTLVMKPYGSLESFFCLNVGGKHEGQGLAPAPMA